MKVKEESEKVGLKLNIQKTKIMASGPITSWQINGETMEAVRDFILVGSKINVDRNCNQEIKRFLLLGGKAITNLDSILRSRDISFPASGSFPMSQLPRLGSQSFGASATAQSFQLIIGVDFF